MSSSPSLKPRDETQYPTVSTQPSHISLYHPEPTLDDTSQRSPRDGNRARHSEQPAESSRATSPRPPSRHVDTDDLEDADSDAASEFDAFVRQGRIDVGQAWDDSSDEDDDAVQALHENRTLPLSATGNSAARKGRRGKRGQPESVLQSLRPTREHRRAWWKLLTNPSTPASLSAPHVSANLFSASLHPAVLLSMPHYFARTGVLLGTIALVAVAVLGGVGGGLWVVLSRYVNGSSVEAIVGASFGRYTPWKGGAGTSEFGTAVGNVCDRKRHHWLLCSCRPASPSILSLRASRCPSARSGVCHACDRRSDFGTARHLSSRQTQSHPAQRVLLVDVLSDHHYRHTCQDLCKIASTCSARAETSKLIGSQ